MRTIMLMEQTDRWETESAWALRKGKYRPDISGIYFPPRFPSALVFELVKINRDMWSL